MVMCFAPTCKHYSESVPCKFFTFPKNPTELAKWLNLIRRKDRNPGTHARICSCHFVDGERKNGPTIFDHDVGKPFSASDTPPIKKRKKDTGLLDATMDPLKEEIKQETLDIKDERASSDENTDLSDEEIDIKDEIMEEDYTSSSTESDESTTSSENVIKHETLDIKDEIIEKDYTSSNDQSDESVNLSEEEIKQEILDIKDEIIEETGVSNPTTSNSNENTNNVKETTDNQVMEFTVSLIRGKKAPKIWRRILVPTNYNFRQFHIAIQKAMGWKSVDIDYHLHAFRILNPTTGRIDFIAMSEDVQLYGGSKDEDATKIKDYFRTKKHKGTYEYDFGAGWNHELIFEKILNADANENYPKCTGGAKACPPEDGVVGSDEEYDSDYFNAEECF